MLGFWVGVGLYKGGIGSSPVPAAEEDGGAGTTSLCSWLVRFLVFWVLSAKLGIEDQLKYVNIDFSKGQRMGVLSLSLHGVFFQASASIPLKQKRECVG